MLLRQNESALEKNIFTNGFFLSKSKSSKKKESLEKTIVMQNSAIKC